MSAPVDPAVLQEPQPSVDALAEETNVGLIYGQQVAGWQREVMISFS